MNDNASFNKVCQVLNQKLFIKSDDRLFKDLTKVSRSYILSLEHEKV